jgi:hypothetical protein
MAHSAFIQCITGALSCGIKRPGPEAATPMWCRGQELWSYTSTPAYVFMGWDLIKNRENFYGLSDCGPRSWDCAALIGAVMNWRRFWMETAAARFKALISFVWMYWRKWRKPLGLLAKGVRKGWK